MRFIAIGMFNLIVFRNAAAIQFENIEYINSWKTDRDRVRATELPVVIGVVCRRLLLLLIYSNKFRHLWLLDVYALSQYFIART